MGFKDKVFVFDSRTKRDEVNLVNVAFFENDGRKRLVKFYLQRGVYCGDNDFEGHRTYGVLAENHVSGEFDEEHTQFFDAIRARRIDFSEEMFRNRARKFLYQAARYYAESVSKGMGKVFVDKTLDKPGNR